MQTASGRSHEAERCYQLLFVGGNGAGECCCQESQSTQVEHILPPQACANHDEARQMDVEMDEV